MTATIAYLFYIYICYHFGTCFGNKPTLFNPRSSHSCFVTSISPLNVSTWSQLFSKSRLGMAKTRLINVARTLMSGQTERKHNCFKQVSNILKPYLGPKRQPTTKLSKKQLEPSSAWDQLEPTFVVDPSLIWVVSKSGIRHGRAYLFGPSQVSFECLVSSTSEPWRPISFVKLKTKKLHWGQTWSTPGDVAKEGWISNRWWLKNTTFFEIPPWSVWRKAIGNFSYTLQVFGGKSKPFFGIMITIVWCIRWWCPL